MKKTRLTETQIVVILKQQENSVPTKELCRKHGISAATIYNWKGKYDGMESSDVKKMKGLEEENAKLKRMYANLALDNEALKSLFTKKGWPLPQKRQRTEELMEDNGISVSRACRIVSLPRSQFYYTSKKADTAITKELEDLAYRHPSYGFRNLLAYLKRAAHPYNDKKVYRVYKLLRLNKRKKAKRRLPSRIRQPLQQLAIVNTSWSMDFMSDSMVGNRKFRTFNVIDDNSREVLAIEADTSPSSRRIIRVLEKVI